MERLRIKLDSIAKMHDESTQCENDIVTTILDAWSLIDVCHRIRRLIFQISGLPHNTAALQIFSRATRQVETLRHYVQHFASGIQSIPRNSYPMGCTFVGSVLRPVQVLHNPHREPTSRYQRAIVCVRHT